jgi:hypothetical protein
MLNLDRPLASSVGIPLEMPMGEARTEIYLVKIEVYPRLKVGNLDSAMAGRERFMTNGNGAEVTGCGRQRSLRGR